MQKDTQKPNFEFIALMASLMSIVALAIDALLPAISDIGIAINSLNPTAENRLFMSGLHYLFWRVSSVCLRHLWRL